MLELSSMSVPVVKVEKLLQDGPDGLFLVKNSTEFAGDLTLCVSFEGSVHLFRVRHLPENKYTVDNDHMFNNVEDLVEFHKTEAGNLPCKLFLAAARENVQKSCQNDQKIALKHAAKRRKKNIDIDEMLIVNRET